MDIDCLMVGEPIPAELCSAEQGSHHCDGCAASTRRCVACQKTRGIADAHRGFCAECVEKNPKVSRREAVTNTVSNLFENFSDRVDDLVDAEIVQGTNTISRVAQTPAISPPILSQPDLIYGMLCEHALARGNAYVVRSVMQLLAIRSRLTESESHLALRKLVSRGQVVILPNEEVRLLKDLEVVASIIERRGEEYTTRGTKTRKKQPYVAPPLTSAKPPVVVAKQASVPVPVAATPVAKGPTIGDLFRFVREMSSVFGAERLARAVIPTISSRLKLPVQDVMNALTKLETDGAIIRKDGWRVVAVLRESHDDATPVVAPKMPTPRHDPVTRERRERREHLHLRVVPLQEQTTQTPEIPPSLPAATSLDEAIERLEQTLPGLRSLRDQVNAKVAMLELSLAQLKLAKTQAEQADAMAKQTLGEAEAAMNDLLSTLRHKA
jgi:hypothetical protein